MVESNPASTELQNVPQARQDVPDSAATTAAVHMRQAAEARRQRRLKLLLPFLLVLVFLAYAFTTNFVPSESMEPTLKPGDHIITMRRWIAYPGGRTPARGDVVVFDLPYEKLPADERPAAAAGDAAAGRMPVGIFRMAPGMLLVKRIVGLPGEEIQVKGGVVYINGKRLQENYKTIPNDADLDSSFRYAVDQPLKLGPDEIFLVGDNRNNSEDARVWGPIKPSRIVGRCVGVLFHEGANGLNEKAAKAAEAQENAPRQ